MHKHRTRISCICLKNYLAPMPFAFWCRFFLVTNICSLVETLLRRTLVPLFVLQL